jgi:serine/threonine protein kinase
MSASPPPAPPRITGFGYVRPLGSGGFADVFQYEQDMPRRVVAIKVLRNKILDARDRSDFEAEADAMARLSNHPSIVSIHTAGVSVDGRPYLVMEYCPESMRDRAKQAPLPLHDVLDAGVRLAGALDMAHAAGIMHRDIKPSNVLLTAAGRPTLTDFGISMLQGANASSMREQALSIPWAAPEVVAGRTSGSPASEMWALGATLYTFAAGRSPFEHVDRAMNTQSKMSARIAQAKYTPIAGAQGYEPFEEVLRKVMQRDPAKRFTSMRELGEALQQLQRIYGYDVTPLDLVSAGYVPAAAATTAEPRGPVVTTVRPKSRAQLRANARTEHLRTDRDGVLVDEPASSMKAGLIGAAVAVVTLGGVVAAALALGWLG